MIWSRGQHNVINPDKKVVDVDITLFLKDTTIWDWDDVDGGEKILGKWENVRLVEREDNIDLMGTPNIIDPKIREDFRNWCYGADVKGYSTKVKEGWLLEIHKVYFK